MLCLQAEQEFTTTRQPQSKPTQTRYTGHSRGRNTAVEGTHHGDRELSATRKHDSQQRDTLWRLAKKFTRFVEFCIVLHNRNTCALGTIKRASMHQMITSGISELTATAWQLSGLSPSPCVRFRLVQTMGDEWLIGVALCLIGAAATCLGMNMQKLSHLRNDALPPEQQRKYIAQKTWVAGFLVFFVGQLLNLGSLGFAPQSLLAVLSSFALVCNIFFANCLLKVRVGVFHFLCGGVVVSHMCACNVSCRKQSTGATSQQQLSLWVVVYWWSCLARQSPNDTRWRTCCHSLRLLHSWCMLRSLAPFFFSLSCST